MDRRKELKEQYRQMKPEMGIYIIRSKISDLCYIEATKDLKSSINRSKFSLGYGSHINKKLQKIWNEQGESNFETEVLEVLKYDKDETKTDYSEELKLLQMIWEEKLTKQGINVITAEIKRK